MPDLTTLTLFATLLFGMIVSQAAFRADTLRVQIIVAPDVAKTGFTEAIAEEVFAAAASRLTEGNSLIPPPILRVRSQPGIVGAIAKSLSMTDIVTAAQNGFGIDHMNVVAAITQGSAPAGATKEPKLVSAPKEPPTASAAKEPPADAKPESGDPAKPGLEMVLVVSQATKGIEQTRIRMVENADPVALVQQSAFWTMERIAPYRVVFAEFLQATRDPSGNLAHAKETAVRVLGRNWEVEQSSERALVYNALALMALCDQDFAQAETQLRLAGLVPGVLPSVHSAIAFNAALIAVAQKQPRQAREWFDSGMKAASSITLPDFDANLKIIEALVQWSHGDVAAAETLLRGALTLVHESEAAHFYLAQILNLKGDTIGSTNELNASQAARRFDPKQQGLVVALFWVDPVKGQLRLRR